MMGSYSKSLPSGDTWASVHGNLMCVRIRIFKKVFFCCFISFGLRKSGEEMLRRQDEAAT